MSLVDHDDGAHAGHGAHGVEQVDGAHDIGRKGSDRIDIGLADERLGGEVKDDLRPVGGKRRRKRRVVADIGDGGNHAIADPGDVEQARRGRRLERIARDLGAERAEPQRQPRALEAGMAGDEDAPALPESGRAHHVFHGARPVLHASSRVILSRIESIGCQKPGCR